MSSFNKSRTIFDCPPKCEGRRPGCHDRCKRYLEKRALQDKINAENRRKRGIDSYQIDSVMKARDINAKKRRDNKNFY